MSEILLSARGLGKQFGGFRALAEIDLDIIEGGITSIIGPNGAGKSTLFNLLSGAFPPSEGSISFEGRDITQLRQWHFAHLGIAKSFQITNVFPHLSAHENVRVAAQALARHFDLWTPRRQLTDLILEADQLLDNVGLSHHRKRRADSLAHGEQRALEIAMALACRPKLLLLDEPTAGMSPEETVAMIDLIQRLALDRTIILVEHKMKMVMGISRSLLVLHHGRLIAEGTPEQIREHPEVRRVYLGEGRRHA
jgi:branched-chain amino acid transport system ATP-binding protein